MKVALISAYDKANGSARAAYRLQQGLQHIGIDSQMLVKEKGTTDSHVLEPTSKLAQGWHKARVTFDGLPLKLYRQRDATMMSLQWLPDNITAKVRQVNPDIINLHWANDAFLSVETIAKLKKPIVWSLHDMWAFTGGCHYTQACDRYLQSCGACPQLGSQKNRDLSRWVWQRKQKAYQKANLTIVALSHWLGECARHSTLLKDTRVEVIHNGIDTECYRPMDKAIARQLLGLPQDKHLVLFGALQATSDKRKGLHLLQPALNDLSQNGWGDKLELVILGSNRPAQALNFGFKTHYLGTFSDDLSLALVYSAADVFVAPSVQENLANTIMESLACGTPCVAFNIGGMPDMIEHEKNGYLATPLKIDSLAHGIAWMLEDQSRLLNLSENSREEVLKNFRLDIQANRYSALFKEIIQAI